MAGKAATDFDRRLGERILKFRVDANVSRRVAAEVLGVSQAQLQKYEAGTNCLKASAMPVLASLFGRDIRDFFDPDPSEIASVSSEHDNPHNPINIQILLQESVNQLERAVNDVKAVLAGISQQTGSNLDIGASKFSAE